jgi:hypothetical protein
LEQLENKIVNAASNFVQPALRSAMLGNQLRFSYVNVFGFNVAPTLGKSSFKKCIIQVESALSHIEIYHA